MSDLVTVAIIGALQALGLAWLNRQSNKREKRTSWRIETAASDVSGHVQTVQKKVEGVGEQVNGQTTALLLASAKLERAEGNVEGRAAERSDRKEDLK